ncbi:hypothetical protein, partial [Lacticaseibacillus paracasei]|uniref:hypothetical protein n=1 Tax=Lacticaseibacillus paracasei TaxID=1597 RepID=UPI002E2FEE6B
LTRQPAPAGLTKKEIKTMTLKETCKVLFGENHSLPVPRISQDEKTRRLLATGCVKVGDIWYRSARTAIRESGVRRGFGGLQGQWVVNCFCTYPGGGRGVTAKAVDVVGM